MFVSDDEARKRLNDPQNLFSSPDSAPISGPSAQDSPAIEPEDDSDEDFELPCLPNLDNLDAIIKTSLKSGRAQYKGCREAQKAIGEVDTVLGNAATSALFGTSPPQTFAYGEGLRSSNEEMGEVPGLKQHLGEVKMQIAMTASRRIKAALSHLNNNKIRTIQDPLKISQVAKDMAQIVDKMSPRDLSEVGAQLHIYRPEVNQVTQYNVVQVRERSKE